MKLTEKSLKSSNGHKNIIWT